MSSFCGVVGLRGLLEGDFCGESQRLLKHHMFTYVYMQGGQIVYYYHCGSIMSLVSLWFEK